MPLIRQVWLLVLGVIVAATLGGVAASVWAAHGYLTTQLALKNNDNAQSLALALSQSGGDATLAALTVSAQFDTGSYRRVVFRGSDGRVLVDRSSADLGSRAPAWFARWVPIEAPAGHASVSDGWKQLGTVELESRTSYAYDALWDGAWRVSAWIVLVGVVAGLVARWAVRRWAQPLDAVVDQAGALIQRRFVTIEEPRTPELHRMARAMNAMVDRVRAMFAEQSDQLEALRRQAHVDSLTGVAQRAHFLAAVSDALGREDGPALGGLLLVRVVRLGELNRRWGRAAIDDLLVRLSMALDRQAIDAGGLVGRLNGSDFGVLVSAQGGLGPVGEQFMQVVREVLDPAMSATVVSAGVECHRGDKLGDLLAAADLALARAEVRGSLAFELAGDERGQHLPLGEEAWRSGLAAALEAGRVRLMSFPVVDAQGRLLHLECPLRIQLMPDHEHEPAARWLPVALRIGQVARCDETALRLALEAIRRDEIPRGVNISPRSLDDAGFLPRLRHLVGAHAAAARRLWIEVDEAAVELHPTGLEELSRQLRPLGVKIGLEHAGHRIAQLGKVLDAGLDYVKLSAAVAGHVADDEVRASHVRGITSILHGMGVAVYAEGVTMAGDLETLWRCRIDGVTGPAIHRGT